MFLFLLFNTSQYSFTGFTGYTFLSGEFRCYPSQICQQLIGIRYIVKPLPVVVEIILYHNSIRSYPFGDVGQQPRSAKKIHKNGTVWESVQYFDEFFGKHTFLPHKRKRGRQIHISHVTFHLKKRRKDLLNL